MNIKSHIANAYAKINLSLDICGIRNDGYHLIQMVMQSISLCDEISIEKNDTNNISIQVISNIATNFKIENQDNIVYKVATSFFDIAQISNRGISILIKKNIPIGAGLGGGSADGATVLKMLNEIYETDFSLEKLASIGVCVGADIPFCLYGSTALVEGIGEIITPIKKMPNCFIVVAKPEVCVNTAAAFKAFDEKKISCKSKSLSLVKAVENADIIAIADNISNVFEQVIAIKEIKDIKKIMHQNGALNQIMTGSGSAVFGIFNDEISADNCTQLLKTTIKDVFLCRPI